MKATTFLIITFFMATHALAKQNCLSTNNPAIDNYINSEKHCQNKPPSTQVCEDISDGYCKSVWSEPSLGNFTVSNGEKFLIGRTKSRLITHASKIDFDAFYKGRCELPADLKTALKIRCIWFYQPGGLLKDLHNHINSEDRKSHSANNSAMVKWQQKLSDIIQQVNRAVYLTADNRTFKRRPQLKTKKTYSIEDKKEFNKDYYDLQNQILEAKYLHHPNWLRAKNVFSKVKADITGVIDDFKLDTHSKKIMIKKVNSVVLSLPYKDPRKLGISSSCANNQINAFYNYKRNKYTICAGLFNSLQSEAAIYIITAHELAHSIDPRITSIMSYYASPLAQLNRQLYLSNGNIPCKNWKQMVGQTYVVPKKVYQQPNPITELSECLIDKSKLSAFSIQALKTPTEASTNSWMSTKATRKRFSHLTEENRVEYGHLKANELYMNPKRMAETNNKHFPTLLEKLGDLHIETLFVQNLRCINENIGKDSAKKTGEVTDINTAENMNKSSRRISDDAFRNALIETKKMNHINSLNYLSFTARESSFLQRYNLSKPSGEAWSDWLAAKAFERYLSRIKNANERRYQLLATQTFHCTSRDLLKKSNKLYIEKLHSHAPHPVKRSRRLQLITSRLAENAKCQQGKETKLKNNSCDDALIIKQTNHLNK